jgi:hypothetical protein
MAPIPVAGDTTVVMAGPPRHEDGGTLVKEYTIGGGGPDQPSEYRLSGVLDIIATTDGNLWLLQSGRRDASGTNTDASLRLYDAQGKFLRSAGGGGGGGGEFQDPRGLAQLRDGRVLLRDGPRINVYSPDGAALNTWTFAASYDCTRAQSDCSAWTEPTSSGCRPE